MIDTSRASASLPPFRIRRRVRHGATELGILPSPAMVCAEPGRISAKKLGGESCRRFRGGLALVTWFRRNVRLMAERISTCFGLVQSSLAKRPLPHIFALHRKRRAALAGHFNPSNAAVSARRGPCCGCGSRGEECYRFGNTTAAFPSSCRPRHPAS
jgi:hypothetical protein